MGQVNSVAVQQSTVNKILQTSNASSIATCTDTIDGGQIIIDGTVAGNVGFDQSCSVSSTTLIDNNLTDQIINLLVNNIGQTNTATGGILGALAEGVAVNRVKASQQIVNSVTQTLNSTCKVSSQLTDTDDVIFVSPQGNVGGNLEFTQSGNISANCTINNTGSNFTNNSTSNTTTQSNTFTSMLASIFGGIVIIAIVGAIGFAITGGNKPSPSSPSSPSAGINKSGVSNKPGGPSTSLSTSLSKSLSTSSGMSSSISNLSTIGGSLTSLI